MSRRLRPTSLPSGILIHPAIWPQQIWPKIGGLRPLLGRGAGSPSNTVWPGPRPTCVPCFIFNCSIQPFGHSTPTSQTGQTGQTDRQRSDSIGRTVLQTVAQQRLYFAPFPSYYQFLSLRRSRAILRLL